jgi:hypothetical protein
LFTFPLQASSVLRNEPEEEEKEEEMETEVQQEEEEEKNSFYSSYKEAVQGEGREGVEDPLREVKILCNGWEHYVPYKCL